MRYRLPNITPFLNLCIYVLFVNFMHCLFVESVTATYIKYTSCVSWTYNKGHKNVNIQYNLTPFITSFFSLFILLFFLHQFPYHILNLSSSSTRPIHGPQLFNATSFSNSLMFLSYILSFHSSVYHKLRQLFIFAKLALFTMVKNTCIRKSSMHTFPTRAPCFVYMFYFKPIT